MTKIVVVKKDNLILSVMATGHSGYATAGHDIVCAAVSVLTQNLANGLKTLLKLNPQVEIDEKEPFIKISVENLSEQDKLKAQILMQHTEMGLKEVANTYKKFVIFKEK